MRHPDWPARLHAFFAARETRPFAWGENDCCIFAAEDVCALTGTDLLAGLPDRWRDAAAAGAAIKRERGLLRAVQRRLGAPLPSPLLAQRGDVVMVRTHLGAAHTRFLAICDSERWAAPGPRGLLRGPMSDAVKAWRV